MVRLKCFKVHVLFEETLARVLRAFFFVKRTFCLISPSSKLKMFTGSVCVLLSGVSLKLIKIKIKLIYATTSS